MSELFFTHPLVRIQFENKSGNLQPLAGTTTSSVTYAPDSGTGSTLAINIRPNQFSWSYGLNTKSFPTYAGEVVQVLSTYIDNLQISGDVRTYHDMELIYKWFIQYITIATQGAQGIAYSETPISLSYPHRGWNLQIRPVNLPSFAYGTEIVVPSWTLEAQIVEDENLKITQMMNQDIPSLVKNDLTKLDANFGQGIQNPFAYWSGSYNQADIKKYIQGKAPIVDPNNTAIADWFNHLVSEYSQGNVNIADSAALFSKPFKREDASSLVQGASSGSLTNPNSNPVGQVKSGNTTATVNSDGYSNIFSKTPGQSRVDQGVDYTGNQAGIMIRAIGNATIMFAGNVGTLGAGGWGPYVAYQLKDGPQKGKVIYVAEGINILVKQGDEVPAGKDIASMVQGGSIEIGWAVSAAPGVYPAPVAHAIYNEGDRTAAGDNFDKFAVSLGAPAGRKGSTNDGYTGSSGVTGHYP